MATIINNSPHTFVAHAFVSHRHAGPLDVTPSQHTGHVASCFAAIDDRRDDPLSICWAVFLPRGVGCRIYVYIEKTLRKCIQVQPDPNVHNDVINRFDGAIDRVYTNYEDCPEKCFLDTKKTTQQGDLPPHIASVESVQGSIKLLSTELNTGNAFESSGRSFIDDYEGPLVPRFGSSEIPPDRKICYTQGTLMGQQDLDYALALMRCPRPRTWAQLDIELRSREALSAKELSQPVRDPTEVLHTVIETANNSIEETNMQAAFSTMLGLALPQSEVPAASSMPEPDGAASSNGDDRNMFKHKIYLAKRKQHDAAREKLHYSQKLAALEQRDQDEEMAGMQAERQQLDQEDTQSDTEDAKTRVAVDHAHARMVEAEKQFEDARRILRLKTEVANNRKLSSQARKSKRSQRKSVLDTNMGETRKSMSRLAKHRESLLVEDQNLAAEAEQDPDLRPEYSGLGMPGSMRSYHGAFTAPVALMVTPEASSSEGEVFPTTEHQESWTDGMIG